MPAELQTVHTGFTFEFNQGKLNAIETVVKKATGNLKKVTADTGVFQQRMGDFFSRAKGVIGTYLGFRVIKNLTMDYANGATEIQKYSDTLGITTDQYQRLTHVAKVGSLTVQEMNSVIPKLAKNSITAASGVGKMAKAFSDANTQVKDSSGKIKDPVTLLSDLSDGLKTVQSGSKRAQLMMTIFGASGRKMGSLMALGSEGIKKAMKEADKMGVVISGKRLKEAAKFNDEMLRVKSIMVGIRNTIAGKLLPSLTRVLRAFQKWWTEGRNAERALKALNLIAFFTALAIGRIITGKVIAQVQAFTTGIIAMARAMFTANKAANLLAIKITAIFLAVVLVAFVIEDLIGFAQGKDSVIGRLLGDTSTAHDLRKALLTTFDELKKAWKEMKPALLDAWASLKPTLRELGILIKPLIGPAFRGAIWFLISSIRFLNFFIQESIKHFETLRTTFAVVSDTFVDASTAAKNAWKTATSEIGAALAIVGKVAQTVGKFMGFDLAGAANTVKKTWTAGLSFIANKVDWLIKKIAKLVGLKDAIFGTTSIVHSETTLKKIAANNRYLNLDANNRDTSDPELGLYAPTAVDLYGRQFAAQPPAAGPGAFGAGVGINAQPMVSNTINKGAVVVTVQATGDPEAIGKVVDARVQAGLRKTLTGASRDIQPPPSGQK